MPRAKAFCRERALDAATQVFWRRGYEAASLCELLEAMGIGRQSLYDTFRDKHALYLECLDRFSAKQRGELAALRAAPSPRKAISSLFEQVAGEPDELKRRGCFVVNATVEQAGEDMAVGRVVGAHQRFLEDLFAGLLERGKAERELPAALEPRPVARFLVAALEGLRVAAKADPSPSTLADVIRVTLSVLD